MPRASTFTFVSVSAASDPEGMDLVNDAEAAQEAAQVGAMIANHEASDAFRTQVKLIIVATKTTSNLALRCRVS